MSEIISDIHRDHAWSYTVF